MNTVDKDSAFSAQKVIVDINLARGRLFKIVHTPDKRTFSRTAGADDNQFFTLFDMKINSFENFKLSEAFMNIFKSYHLYHFLSADMCMSSLIGLYVYYSKYAEEVKQKCNFIIIFLHNIKINITFSFNLWHILNFMIMLYSFVPVKTFEKSSLSTVLPDMAL